MFSQVKEVFAIVVSTALVIGVVLAALVRPKQLVAAVYGAFALVIFFVLVTEKIGAGKLTAK